MATPPLVVTGEHLPPGFWETDELVILQNPRAPQPLPSILPESGVLFATSGSSGVPKWLRHTRASLLASAAAVNQRFQMTEQTVWARALPLFHVGGMGIAARAHLSGARIVEVPAPWSAAQLTQICARAAITHCSLVPTQIFDLVHLRQQAPSSLQAVLVGGGKLSPDLKEQALALGWPVLETYGLTEAASQVATETNGKLTLLDCWQARVNAGDCLEINGPALAAGKWSGDSWQPLTSNGWFATTDRVRLEERTLTWLGRKDATIKVLGELVDVETVAAALSQCAHHPVYVIFLADARIGHRLYASPVSEEALRAYHADCAPFARITAAFPEELIHRSALGKLQRAPTQAAVTAWLGLNAGA